MCVFSELLLKYSGLLDPRDVLLLITSHKVQFFCWLKPFRLLWLLYWITSHKIQLFYSFLFEYDTEYNNEFIQITSSKWSSFIDWILSNIE